MKNKKTNAANILRLLGIIAIATVIGFSMASCFIIPDDDDDYDDDTPNTSLNGAWSLRTGSFTAVITVSGSNGMLTSFNSTDAGWSDCYNKGYINQWWRYLQSTGNLTWSGQQAWCQVYVSNQNVSSGVSWPNITIVMSADGKRLTVSEKNANGIGDKWTQTCTR